MLVTSPVRKADRRDEDEILEMCRELHVENGCFPLNIDKVRTIVRRAFDRQGAIVGAIGPSGKIEGTICLLISCPYYSDSFYLDEVWNYVRPQFRRSENAKNLIEFAKRCAEELGIPLMIGVVSNERTAAKLRLYERKLGAPAGGFFMYPKANGTSHLQAC